MDRPLRRLAMIALRIEREIDHHDRILLHDADQHDDADDRDDAEVHLEQHQRQERADTGRRQAREIVIGWRKLS